ncbi:MAG TPA: NAD(P)-dependent oxidoreductase, partial [Vitreoscilla sp.]|nr:NAD(P)-dependent oxidoreductase [Vitreoscilla sp.]
MDYYPMFARLQQRPVLVVGAGQVAERKVDSLLQSGALVR